MSSFSNYRAYYIVFQNPNLYREYPRLNLNLGDLVDKNGENKQKMNLVGYIDIPC